MTLPTITPTSSIPTRHWLRSGPALRSVDLGNIEDGKWHGVHVSWDAALQTLSYSFDGKQAGTLTGDLASRYFAGFNYAYFGFTAASGGLSNLQQVEINALEAVLEDGTQVHFGEPPVPCPCP